MARVAGTFLKPYMKPSRRSKKLKRRDCLRCDREFWSEGPHHRLCQICRQVIAASPSPVEEYSVLTTHESGRSDLMHVGRI
jgi:5-methylcytosine-specific restriction endonuclease McrA